MTGRTPAARVPTTRTPAAGLHHRRPAPSRWHRACLMAMWQMLVSLGAAFAPPPVWPDDDPYEQGWSELR